MATPSTAAEQRESTVAEPLPWSARGAARLAWGAAYTMWMCQRALFERALGAPDDRVRQLAREWAAGMRRGAGIEVRATGVELVDWSRPVVIMANHQSYLDVLALYSVLPVTCGFVAKKQLFQIPFFGSVMEALGCVPVDRERREDAMSALDDAARRVKGGSTIAIFPEGTRSRGDRIARLKKGPFYLVQLAGVPTVPIGIRGTARLMPRENTHLESGTVEVAVGLAIPPPEEGPAARAHLAKRVRMELSRLSGLPERD